jgi:uridine phosphorylase
MDDIELLLSRPDEQSVLTPQLLMRHRMKKRRSDPAEFPRFCLLGFFPSLYSDIKRCFKTKTMNSLHIGYPYLFFEKEDTRFAFIYPGIGAPLSGAVLEETIALGGEYFLFFGSAGILENTVRYEELMIPSYAVRDEGTSFHYEEPRRHAYADKEMITAIQSIFHKNCIASRTGLTWTTDAVFREIPSKILRMQEEGCLSVDMEAAALFTIANYHKKKIGGFFIPEDTITPSSWSPRIKTGNLPHWKPFQLLELAAEILMTFSKKKQNQENGK